MVSKNQIKLIKSLSQKKFRNKHQLFVVEGIKGVREFLNSPFPLVSLYTAEDFVEVPEDRIIPVDEKDLKKISFLSTPQTVMGVFKMKEFEKISWEGLILALDGVRDPGNLGTIIRLCDWFGIQQIICSRDTVDCYNPKVVQATMGSLARVKIYYEDLPELLSSKKGLPVYGTLLEGGNIYSEKMPENAVIVMGNEANGISEAVKETLTRKINIPQFGEIQQTESLNVATATAIVLNEFRRSFFTER